MRPSKTKHRGWPSKKQLRAAHKRSQKAADARKAVGVAAEMSARMMGET